MHFIFLLTSCLISFHHAFSIPFESESGDINLFDSTLSEPDGSQDSYSTLSSIPTDLFSANGYENSNTDNPNIFLSDSLQSDNNNNNNNYCHLGKRQDIASGGGDTCDSSTSPPPSPLQLTLPGLNDLFMIENKLENQQGTQANPAQTETEAVDPCALVKLAYPQHACCQGPLGPWQNNEYFTVYECDPGIYPLPFPHSRPLPRPFWLNFNSSQ